MPKRNDTNWKDDEGYGLKNLLSDVAKLTGGKKSSSKFNFYVNAAKNLFSFSGLDKKATKWLLTKALTNPNIASSLFKIRSLINKDNAEMFLNFSLTMLIPSDNEISILLGIVSIGMIHRRFPLEEDYLKECKSELRQLLIHKDTRVKDAATVILKMLGDSIVDKESVQSAQRRLTQGGIDINSAIEN